MAKDSQVGVTDITVSVIDDEWLNYEMVEEN